jgi:hypothetical protein
MRIHAPSLVVGLFATLFLVIFAAAQRPPVTMGRFELEATPNHVFVLDRDTGRVWQKFVTNDTGQSDQDFAQPKLRN